MNDRYTWLLFDADGTLLDYKAAETYALKTAVESFGYRISSDVRERYHRINSGYWAMLEKGEISSKELRVRRFETLAEELNWTFDAADFSTLYLRELGCSGFMIEGARDMLERLPSHMTSVIITNGIKDVQYGRLNDAGIRDLFAEVIISEEAGEAKPSSVFFDYAFERMNFPEKDKMLVIGDSLTSDIAGGNGYGIDTCWFNPEGYKNTSEIKPTYEVRNWQGFFDILGINS